MGWAGRSIGKGSGCAPARLVSGKAALAFGARTDVGSVRRTNEDAYLARPPHFAVADGVGGHASGDFASSLAIRRLAEAGQTVMGSQVLASLVKQINSAVRESASANSSRHGMATTLTVLEVDGPNAHLAHVGDSRAYVYRDRSLRRLTTDHTFASELVEAGDLTPDDAERMVDSTVLTQALGSSDQVRVDTRTIRLHKGDRVLLCTDGLTQELTDPAITRVLGRAATAQAAADELIDAAIVAGGRDNVTCVVVDVNAATRRTPRPPRRRYVVVALLAMIVAVAMVVALWVLFGGALSTTR